jgi:DNA repair exonuclease SbcCD nuclease subunit
MENRKIWLIADTHFGLKGDDDEWLDDCIGYFENVVIPIMEKEVGENDILIHCGDVFDNRATIGLNTICRTIKLFEKFSTIFKDIRITVGNHDIMKKSSNDITSLNILKYIPNVKIYYEPVVEVIDGKSCLFNPWIENVEKEKELLSGVNVDYIFGHLEINGVQASNRSGVKVDFLGGVKSEQFKTAQVYAGHIHIRQDNKNIHYIGNPYHKDRGDRDNKKGITVLDIKTGETRFIENTVSPRFMKENIYDILDLTVGDLKERWKNNRIDLHVKGNDITKCKFDDLTSALGNCYKSFLPVGDNVTTELDITGEVNFNDAKSSDDYIGDFLQNQDLDDDMMKTVQDKLIEYRDRL